MLSHTRRKNSLDSQSTFVPILQSAVYILYLVYNLYPVYSLQSAFCILTSIHGTNTVYFWLQLFAQLTKSTTKYLFVSLFDIFVPFRVNTLLYFCENVDITYNVSSNPPTPQKITLGCIACLCFHLFQ